MSITQERVSVYAPVSEVPKEEEGFFDVGADGRELRGIGIYTPPREETAVTDVEITRVVRSHRSLNCVIEQGCFERQPKAGSPTGVRGLLMELKPRIAHRRRSILGKKSLNWFIQTI